MAWTNVKEAHSGAFAVGTGVTSQSATFASAVGAGNLVVGWVYTAAAQSVTGISDGKGNAYVATDAQTAAGQSRVTWFYGINITGGPTTITVTHGNSTRHAMQVREFSCTLGAQVWDTSKSNSQTNPGTLNNSITTTAAASGTAVATELLWAAAIDPGTVVSPAISAGTGFTSGASIGGSNNSIDEYKLNAGAAGTSVVATFSDAGNGGSHSYLSGVLAFKEVSANVNAPFAGSASGTSTVTGAMRRAQRMAGGAAGGTSTVTGTMRTAKRMVGSVTAGAISPRCLVFSGDTSATTAPSGTAANTTAAFTVEFWAQINGTSPQAQFLLEKFTNVLNWRCFAYADGLTVEFDANPGEIGNIGLVGHSVGVPFHGAWTYNPTGGVLSSYLNGVLNSQYTGVADMAGAQSPGTLYLGSFNPYVLNGKLGQIRIWSGVRTQAEIAANMRRAMPVGTTNMVSQWIEFPAGATSVPNSGSDTTPITLAGSTVTGTLGIDAVYGVLRANARMAGGAAAGTSTVTGVMRVAKRFHGFATGGARGTNYAVQSAGGVASASSSHASGNYPPSYVNDGVPYSPALGPQYWNDDTPSTFPDWWQVTFAARARIDTVVVYSLQDAVAQTLPPTDTMVGTLFAVKDFTVETTDYTNFPVTAPVSVAVTNNNLIKRTVRLAAPVVADYVRINITATQDGGYSRLTEVEAYAPGVVGYMRTAARMTGGAAAGTSTVAGVMRTTRRMTGAASGTSTVSGAMSTVSGTSLQGTASGTSTVTGVMRSTKLMVGTSAGTSTAAGVGTSVFRLAGTATGASTVTGVGRAKSRVAGTSAGSSTVVGTTRLQARASGTSTGSSTVVGVMRKAQKVVGASAGTSTVTGILRAAARMTGTSSGVSTVNGAMTSTGIGGFVGNSMGHSSATGVMRSQVRMTGTASGVGSATGTMLAGVQRRMAGASAGSSTVDGVGAIQVGTVGNAAGTGTAVGTMRSVARMVGNADGTSTVDGEIEILIGPMQGTAAGTSTADGVMSAEHRMVGNAAGTSTVRGRMTGGLGEVPRADLYTTLLVARLVTQPTRVDLYIDENVAADIERELRADVQTGPVVSTTTTKTESEAITT